jgi:hypothetical protein
MINKNSAFLLFGLMLVGGSSMAKSIEEPKYDLVYSAGSMEIRQYKASIQAVTKLASKKATTSGFQRLAGYIFGGNDDGASIAMTAPVQETLETNEPALAFTMPSDYRYDALPDPNDDSVSIVEVPERTMAVISFSGWATSAKIGNYLTELEQQLLSHGLESIGYPMLNQYNPPWTPPFLRRNEVMVEIIFSTVLPSQAALAW